MTEFRYEWIWRKSNPNGFLSANKRPMRTHEDVLVFCDTAPPYNPQVTYTAPRRAKGRGTSSSNYNQGVKRLPTRTVDYHYPRDVLEYDKDPDSFHPTQKPVALCEYLIRTYTDEGMTVLDNCMGSGTTGVAAVQTGRDFIGIEKDPDYYQKAVERISKAQYKAKGRTTLEAFA